MIFARAGAFELHRPRARGGVATVWEAVHPASGSRAAVKLSPRLATLDEATVRQEAAAVAALDHPHVVDVFDAGLLDDAAADALGVPAGCPWLAMELADGDLLEAADHALSWPELRSATLQILDALAHVHARRVLHRDLKPENILRFGASTWKLGDFGIARALDPTRDDDDAHASSGTVPYMAPEQILGDTRDDGPWTDLYALGCTVYRLASGRFPFVGDTAHDVLRAHLYGAPRPFEPAPGVPSELAPWLDGCIRRSPRERFRSAAEAAAALLDVSVGAATPLPAAPRLTTLPIDDADWLGASAELGAPRAVARRGALPADWRTDRAWSEAPANTGQGLVGLRRGFVGREAERDALWGRLREVVTAGEAAAVVISGAEGVGRTRLARWVAERAHEVGAAVAIEVPHDPSGDPGHGLVRLVHRVLRTSGLLGAALSDRVRHALDGAVDDAAEGLVLSLLSGAPVAPADREAAARIALGSLGGPVVLCLDDVHHDEVSAAFARRLLQEPGLPVLVVATCADGRAVLGDAAPRLPLGPLDAASMRALVRTLLGVSPGFGDALEDRAAGNPGFAVRLVEDLARRGALAPTGSGLELAGEAPALPGDLAAAWDTELDRLGDAIPGALEALETAAALGSAFTREHLSAASAAAGRVAAGLVRAGAWVEVDGELAFADPALREAARDRAVREGRWAARNAACLEVAGASAGQRGRWLLAAGRPAEALAALEQAWIDAFDHTDQPAALRSLADRREALTRAGVPAGGPRWARCAVDEADSHVALRSPEARAKVEVALREASASGSPRLEADALSLKARLESAAGAHDAAELGFRAARSLYEAAGDPVRVVRTDWRLAEARALRGDLRGARDALLPLVDRFRALASPERHLRADVALVEQALGEVLLNLGERAEAITRLERSAVALEDHGARGPALTSWIAATKAHVAEADPVGAQRAVAHVERLARTAPPLRRADALQTVGAVALLQGDAARAEALQRQVVALLGRCGAPAVPFGVALVNHGSLLLTLDRPDDARAALDDALARFASVRSSLGNGIAHAFRAACAAPAEIGASLDEVARDLVRTGYTDPEVARALDRAADRLVALGELEAAGRARRLAGVLGGR